MVEPKKNKDSKISRSFLRMILKEQGKAVPEELTMNSWELLDLIIKNINILAIEMKNLKKENRLLNQEREARSQQTMEAIEAFYGSMRRRRP